MRAKLLCALAFIVMMVSLPPSTAHTQSSKDHPVIAPYPGSTMSRRYDAGFSEYRVVTSLNPEGQTDDEKAPSMVVRGTLTQLAYESPRDRSPLEIFTNYKEALESAGFTILADCHACSATRRAIGRVSSVKYVGGSTMFISAQLKQGEKETYVTIAIIKPRHAIDILEREEMERGLVVVTPEQIAQGLLLDGRAVLDGIYFDTDKSTLKPESDTALDVIATFLKDRPDVKAYIVGHTDGTGTFDHNMTLSRERATAVVTALVERYGIAKDRLAPHGVGPLSPTRTNKSDSGRDQNRRVEMVEM